MNAKKTPKVAPVERERDPLVITVSELRALSDAEQQAFRNNGGTVVSDSAIKPNEPETNPES